MRVSVAQPVLVRANYEFAVDLLKAVVKYIKAQGANFAVDPAAVDPNVKLQSEAMAKLSKKMGMHDLPGYELEPSDVNLSLLNSLYTSYRSTVRGTLSTLTTVITAFEARDPESKVIWFKLSDHP